MLISLLPPRTGPFPPADTKSRGIFPKFAEQDFLIPVIISSRSLNLKVWNGLHGVQLDDFYMHTGTPMSCDISPSREIAVGAGFYHMELYQIRENRPRGASAGKATSTLKGHESFVTCARFSDDNIVISTSGDGTARIWDVGTAKEVLQIPHSVLNFSSHFPFSFAPSNRPLKISSTNFPCLS